MTVPVGGVLPHVSWEASGKDSHTSRASLPCMSFAVASMRTCRRLPCSRCVSPRMVRPSVLRLSPSPTLCKPPPATPRCLRHGAPPSSLGGVHPAIPLPVWESGSHTVGLASPWRAPPKRKHAMSPSWGPKVDVHAVRSVQTSATVLSLWWESKSRNEMLEHTGVTQDTNVPVIAKNCGGKPR